MSLSRIRNFYEHYDGQVYVSFSGGKDSTVLLHLVRSIYPSVPAVFVDTGLEYPEIKRFVGTVSNVTTIRPKQTFKQVLDEFGYPVISKKVARQIHDLQNPNKENIATRHLYLTGIKRDGSSTKTFKLPQKWRELINAPFKISGKCCDIMKKYPIHSYERETGRKGFVGTMASDSHQREISYLQTGCNNFKRNVSMPIAFWTEDDVWQYLRSNKIPYSPIYDTGIRRTGCMFCMFGVHLEKRPNRFELMKKTHPKLYYYCMRTLGLADVLDYIGVGYDNPHKLPEIIKQGDA